MTLQERALLLLIARQWAKFTEDLAQGHLDHLEPGDIYALGQAIRALAEDAAPK